MIKKDLYDYHIFSYKLVSFFVYVSKQKQKQKSWPMSKHIPKNKT